MTEKPDVKNSLFARITTETAIYGVLLLASLALRLVDLDARPMGNAEATRALGAWHLAQGREPASVGSPLLTHGTALVFFIFGANDFTARLLPALVGALMAVVPYFWRERLGREGALLAAFLLAVSPLGLFASRSLGPEALAAACGLGLATALVRFADTGAPRALYASAALLGLLLASGPGAYFVLLALAAVAVAVWALSRRGIPPATALRDRLNAARANLRTAVFVFLGTAAGVGALLLFHVAGLRGLADVLDAWWHGFGGGVEMPWFSPIVWPLLYEPVVWVFGLIGGIRAVRERDLLGSSLLECALGISVMLMAWPTRTSGDLLLVTGALALLAGREIARLVRAARSDWRGLRDWAYAALFGVLAVYVYLQLAGFADRGDTTFALLAWVGVGLIAVLTVGQGTLHGADNALRNLGVAGAALTLAITLSAAFGSAYNAGGKNAEYLEPVPTSPRARALAADVATWSLRRVGDAHEMSVAVALSEPAVMAWYLRDFRNLAVYEGNAGPLDADAIIAPEGLQPMVRGDYIGQAYELTRDCHWRALSARDWWRWALRRTLPASSGSRVVLWIKASSE